MINATRCMSPENSTLIESQSQKKPHIFYDSIYIKCTEQANQSDYLNEMGRLGGGKYRAQGFFLGW